MMDYLICGDTHADSGNIGALIDIALEKKCEGIVVCGDFGCYPHIQEFNQQLKKVSNYAKQKNIKVYFIKGNHEDHLYLSQFKEISEIYSNIYYIPNNCILNIEGIKIGAMGGAFSIDYWRRIEGHTYFKNELISEEDIENCMEHVDILLSHDSPINNLDIDLYVDYKFDSTTLLNRHRLQLIIDKVKPKYIIHGHYHFKRLFSTSLENGIKIPCLSLDCNFNIQNQWTLLSSIVTHIRKE